MTQESLNFGRLHTVSDAARSVYRFLNDAVDSVGIVTATGACGIDRADLRRALDRDRRYVAVEHAMAIASLVSSSNFDLSTKISAAIVKPMGLTVELPKRMTPEERNAARVEAARRLAPGLMVLVDAEVGE